MSVELRLVVGLVALVPLAYLCVVLFNASRQLARMARGEASPSSFLALIDLGSAMLFVAAGLFLLAASANWITILLGFLFIGVGARFAFKLRDRMNEQ